MSPYALSDFDKNRSDDFDNAFKQLILNEGEWSNDKFDPGGKTIYGITIRDYPEYYSQVYMLWNTGRKEVAKELVKHFYKKNFWNTLYEEIPDSSLAFKIFDLSVNRGKKTAIKILQETIFFDFGKTIKRDGIFGKITLGAIQSIVNQELLYNKYIERSEASYRLLPTFWRFGKGWINRLRKRVYV